MYKMTIDHCLTLSNQNISTAQVSVEEVHGLLHEECTIVHVL